MDDVIPGIDGVLVRQGRVLEQIATLNNDAQRFAGTKQRAARQNLDLHRNDFVRCQELFAIVRQHWLQWC